MAHTFTSAYIKNLQMAQVAISRYNGDKVISLEDGSKAIDNDDSYIIIGNGLPTIRDKRMQRLYDNGKIKKIALFAEDSPIGECMDDFDICELADSLAR